MEPSDPKRKSPLTYIRQTAYSGVPCWAGLMKNEVHRTRGLTLIVYTAPLSGMGNEASSKLKYCCQFTRTQFIARLAFNCSSVNFSASFLVSTR